MRFILMLAFMFVVSSLSQPTHGQAVTKGPWAELNKKTAWMLLAVLADDNTPQTVKSFEWPDGTVANRMPEKGERIKLLSTQDLVIINFGTTKEMYAFRSPTTLDRPLEDGDYTKLKCLKGAILVVADKSIGKPIEGLRQVWVRVTPPA